MAGDLHESIEIPLDWPHLEDVAPEARGDPEGRMPFTQVPDWVMVCERIPATAFRLWSILRSMQFENGGPGIPPLTLDEVCWLLPGVKGKPTSKSRARQALDELLEEGILEDVSEPGLGRAAARTYVTHDKPVRQVEHRSARRKLKLYWTGWRG